MSKPSFALISVNEPGIKNRLITMLVVKRTGWFRSNQYMRVQSFTGTSWQLVETGAALPSADSDALAKRYRNWNKTGKLDSPPSDQIDQGD